ncbi:formyltransferase family protein [Escherichia coli]
MLNIHPSRCRNIPDYTPIVRRWKMVMKSMILVHFVTDELDGGPVILQAKVPVFAGDTEDGITARVQTQLTRYLSTGD